MYLDFFGFKHPPFSITPDPDFLFLSHDHKEAFAHLLYGVEDSGGFVLLTGEVGTGKTTLCRYLLENVAKEVDVALILNPRQSALELVASICDELGVSYPTNGDSIKPLIDRLNAHLLQRHAQGRRTVLVIDEAQNLSVEVLEQIRLLTNLETARHKLLQILLIGQPELQAVMQKPEMRQLDQRITARYHLTPLSLPETITYISHRQKVAGARRNIFSKRALKQIYRRSGGVPRIINIICDRALLGAYANNIDTVDVKLIKQAEREIKGQSTSTDKKASAWAWRMATLLFIVIGGSLAYTWWPVHMPKMMVLETANQIAFGEKSLPAEVDHRLPLTKESSAAIEIEAPPLAASNPHNPVSPAGKTHHDDKAGISAKDRDHPYENTFKTTPSTVIQRPGGDSGSSGVIITTAGTDRTADILDGIDRVEHPPGNAVFKAPTSFDAAPHNLLEELDNERGRNIRSDLLAMSIPRENRQPQSTADLAILLDDVRQATDANTAFVQLFRRWQVDFNELPGHTACVRALSAGLRCLQKTGSLSNLTLYNRPAVLTLFNNRGQVHYVTLISVEGDQMILDIGGHEYRFDQIDVLSAWNGQFVLLWRPPILENSTLQMGSQGNDVLWLRDRLARSQGVPPLSSESAKMADFDADLRQQVVRFQEIHGLKADGVVGENTLIQLNTAIDDDRTPVLTFK